MRIVRLLVILLSLSLLLVLAPMALAQSETTGDLTGTLTDASGAVIPDSLVTITGSFGEIKEAKTNAQGQYRFAVAAW